ncbi:transmembrane protein 231 [Octopus bimaculoides]|uniref:transmembrane protein 231 n=1 Tax=Octopus bimaculoides TaxID=37653 RepID=UPI00071C5FEE|nr:transmembrane protein 231 [Octopus bimaculoides]|eukprot:XP_014772534.1 PREDICTED: transmembrane protein 231-like [Octopus bimaculoides]
MAVFEIFSHAELRRYRSHIFSKATALQVFITLSTYILPFVVIYLNNGLWIGEARFRDQPKIVFKKELLFLLYTTGSTQSYVTYSTFENYNKLQQDSLRIPLIKSIEEDVNEDEKLDNLQLTLEVPLYDSENVVAIEMLLFFHYELHKHGSLYMNSMAYIHHSSVIPGAKIDVYGTLETVQRIPLHYKGNDIRFNTSVIDSDSAFASAYDLSNILKKYHERNVTTKLIEPYYVWTIGRGAKMPFIISVTINYPQQEFIYTPSLLYQLKWGWVQYVSLLIFFLVVGHNLKVFIFSNQLVNTIITRPYRDTGLKLS